MSKRHMMRQGPGNEEEYTDDERFNGWDDDFDDGDEPWDDDHEPWYD